MAKKEKIKPEKPAKPAKEKAPKAKKGKKGAAASTSAPGAGTASTPLADMTPEQMTAAQIEQAIKESNDPNARLKKLRSPLNVRSCLLNVLILLVATLIVVIIWCVIVVDKFNFVTVMSDMMEKFHITQFFTNLGNTISGWFK